MSKIKHTNTMKISDYVLGSVILVLLIILTVCNALDISVFYLISDYLKG